MLEEGSVPGDLAVLDLDGRSRNLRDFRRRLHVVLLWDPSANQDDREAWRDRRRAESQRWSWIGAEVVVPSDPLREVSPGIYLISRWGKVIGIYPPGSWDLDRVEHEILVFEARDSCS
jgi:hypothetical protein